MDLALMCIGTLVAVGASAHLSNVLDRTGTSRERRRLARAHTGLVLLGVAALCQGLGGGYEAAYLLALVFTGIGITLMLSALGGAKVAA